LAAPKVQNWLKGGLLAIVADDRSITATADDLEILPFPKPNMDEDYGQSWNAIAAIRQRIPGRMGTMAHFGGATAVLVPSRSVARLSEGEMQNWSHKFGGFGNEWMAVLARNAKPRVWTSALSLAGGMFESPDFLWELLEEMLELGIFNDEGWLRYILPEPIKHLQARFDDAQDFWWNVVRPGFPCIGTVQIESTGIGKDSLNGIQGIFTIGENLGDAAITQVVRVNLSLGTGWRFLDTESVLGTNVQAWFPMRRRPWLIAPRDGRAPVALPLDADGRLDGLGVPFVIDGENITTVITDVTRGALEGLGWLR